MDQVKVFFCATVGSVGLTAEGGPTEARRACKFHRDCKKNDNPCPLLQEVSP